MLKTSFLVLTSLGSFVFTNSAMADCGGSIYAPQAIFHFPTTPYYIQACPTVVSVAHATPGSIAVGDIVHGERVVCVGPVIKGVPKVVEQTSSSSVEGSLNRIQSDLQAIKSRLGI